MIINELDIRPAMENFNPCYTDLPPGFRFHPTDEELVAYYLLKKAMDCNFTSVAITEVDLNKCEPWSLPGRAKMGEKEWYFFSTRGKKYPTGSRTNRATQAGYWKATGKDREIYCSKTGTLVGMKKTLVYYRGRAPRGEKSNWIKHEYRFEGKLAHHYYAKDEWVICRVFQKNVTGGKKRQTATINLSSLPPLLDPSTGCEGCSFDGKEGIPCFTDHKSIFDLPPHWLEENMVQPVDLTPSMHRSGSDYGGGCVSQSWASVDIHEMVHSHLDCMNQPIIYPLVMS